MRPMSFVTSIPSAALMNTISQNAYIDVLCFSDWDRRHPSPTPPCSVSTSIYAVIAI